MSGLATCTMGGGSKEVAQGVGVRRTRAVGAARVRGGGVGGDDTGRAGSFGRRKVVRGIEQINSVSEQQTVFHS